MKRRSIYLAVGGGWGDLLLSTPVFKALKKTYADSRIVVFCPKRAKREIFKGNPYIDDVKSTSLVRNPITSFYVVTKRWKVTNLRYLGLVPSIFPTKTAVELIGEMAGVELEDKKIEIFLSEKEDMQAQRVLASYPNPICIEASSRISNTSWQTSKWEELIRQMPEYSFIQLGEGGDEVCKGAMNFLGKTSFRQAAALIKNARSFVGVESAFAHVTNAFDIAGVVLFGPGAPEVWGHPNNINIFKHIRCSPCSDLLGHAPCPYGATCMSSISVEEVKEALIRQLSKTKSGQQFRSAS